MKNNHFTIGQSPKLRKTALLMLFFGFTLMFFNVYSQCVLANEVVNMEHHQQMTESDCEGFCDVEKEPMDEEEVVISQSDPIESQVVQKTFLVTKPRTIPVNEKRFEPWIYLNYLPGTSEDKLRLRI